MQLAVFTDEISPDPIRAIQLAAEWGIPAVEIRGLPGGRFPAPTDAELGELGKRIADAGLVVSGVSPGFFKTALEDTAVARTLAADLPRACEWAQRWGTDLVSCFAFARGAGPVPGLVVERLGQMTGIAAGLGCRLALENEAACWGDSGCEAADIVRGVDMGSFRLLWDPGNAAKAGAACPYPDEYEQLCELVTHVHMKNYDAGTGAWSLMESGAVNWPAQLQALKRDAYDGYLVLETHQSELPVGHTRIDGLTALETNSWRNREFVRAHLGL